MHSIFQQGVFPKGYWNDKVNHKKFVEWIAHDLQVKHWEDWYKITHEDIIKRGGTNLLHNYYKSSPSLLITTIYPQYAWKVWRFESVPNKYWDSLDHQREFLTELAADLGLKSWDDWYHVTREQIMNKGGQSLLQHQYRGSISSMVTSVFPHHPWQVWKFDSIPLRYWDNKENQLNFMNWLANELNVDHWEKWYNVSQEQITHNGGGGLLLTQYNNSRCALLMGVFPQYPWRVWKFDSVPQGYWDDKDHQVEFMNWLAGEIGIKHWEDWYEVSTPDIASKGGSALLQHQYHASPSSLIISVYPTYPWRVWKFKVVPHYFVEDKELVRSFFDVLAEELDLKFTEDWYKITRDEVLKFGKLPLLTQNSLGDVLSKVYPDTTWQLWHFKRSAMVLAENAGQSNWQYMEWLKQQLHISHFRDWYGVTDHLIKSIPGGGVISKVGLMNWLTNYYPGEEWDLKRWIWASRSKTQQLLLSYVQELLPKREIECEWELNWQDLKYRKTSEQMTFDLWIPTMNLSFEYQGIQHFEENSLLHAEGGLHHQFEKDKEKRNAFNRLDLTLVGIPYWWKCNIHALANELHYKFGINMPPNSSNIRGIEESAPNTMEPKQVKFGIVNGSFFEPSKGYNWNYTAEATARWGSIKHNGVRIVSDGAGNFFTKSAKQVFPPPSVTKIFSCGIPLEFEFCIHEERGPRTASSIILNLMHQRMNNKDKETAWSISTLYVFDAPLGIGDIQERVNFAKHMLSRLPTIKFVQHWKLHEQEHLIGWMGMFKGQVEGLILHDANTSYMQGRHTSVLKVKVLRISVSSIHPIIGTLGYKCGCIVEFTINE